MELASRFAFLAKNTRYAFSENRLTLVSDDASHSFRSSFVYDGLGRMRIRREYAWSAAEFKPSWG